MKIKTISKPSHIEHINMQNDLQGFFTKYLL